MHNVKAVFDRAEWDDCSDQQAAVIEHALDGRGSIGVVARAGCGKTYLLEKVTKAIIQYERGGLIAMAFNTEIADELDSRFKQAGYDFRAAAAGTVHSFGLRAWRRAAPTVKVDDDKVSNIIKTLAGGDRSSDYFLAASPIEKLVSLAKQKALGHVGQIDDTEAWVEIFEHFNIEDSLEEGVAPSSVIRCAQRVYKQSLESCKEVVDCDDMLLAPLYYKASFLQKKWILLDEAQDTNAARRLVALAMLNPYAGRMIYVGDPAQAIYGFTGADSNSMELLRMATNATVMPLNVTRRCPKSVVAAAQQFVPDFVAHEDAPEGAVRSISFDDLDEEGLTKDDVILCRLTWPLVQTALTLVGKGIACRVEGRDIGEELVTLAQRREADNLWDLMQKLDTYQREQNAKFIAKGEEYHAERLADKVDCLRVIIKTCLSESKTGVDALVEKIGGMFGSTKGGEMLTLATGHRSKGREWRRVYLYGRETWLPSPHAKKDWQKDQEQHLEYVMLTRSKGELIDVPARPRERTVAKTQHRVQQTAAEYVAGAEIEEEEPVRGISR